MKKFSKAQLAEKASHVAAVQLAYDGVELAYTDYNDAVRLAHAKLAEARVAYSEKLDAANEWRDNLATEAIDYFDERSEAWQEGDVGSQYSSWLEALGVEFESLDELDEFEDLELPENGADKINELPDDPGCA